MTRYAILSDIHANIDALEAVLRHKDQLKPAVDQVWCLGDLVVYGVEPGSDDPAPGGGRRTGS